MAEVGLELRTQPLFRSLLPYPPDDYALLTTPGCLSSCGLPTFSELEVEGGREDSKLEQRLNFRNSPPLTSVSLLSLPYWGSRVLRNMPPAARFLGGEVSREAGHVPALGLGVRRGLKC